MPGAAERVLVLYAGADPKADEVMQIIGAVKRSNGLNLEGTRVTTIDAAMEPDEGLAQALIVRMEGEGRLSPGALERTIIHCLSVNGATRVVAVVQAAGSGGRPDRGRASRGRRERTPWARELIPRHLAKLDQAGTGLAWRPGWATLSGEQALSFAASAKDGATLALADVRILVSLFRVTEPERIQKRMSGGYTAWVSKVASAAGVKAGAGQPDIAHWLLCADRKTRIVHLGYFPSSGSEALLPWDLIPPDEQRETPRLA